MNWLPGSHREHMMRYAAYLLLFGVAATGANAQARVQERVSFYSIAPLPSR